VTPKSTIVAAYLKCLGDLSLNRELIECSRNKHFILAKPGCADGEATKSMCTIYDPLLVVVHGEFSWLEDIVRPELAVRPLTLVAIQ
jgi:hypothetical protein